MDYPTIPRALAIASAKKSSKYMRSNSSSKKEQTTSVDILLRPGKHYVKESLVVTAGEDVTVAIKTMKLPSNRFQQKKTRHHG